VKTDDLIELLVKDLVPWRFRSILAGAVAGGIIIAAILFFVGIGFRPDIFEAVKKRSFPVQIRRDRLAGCHRDLGDAQCRGATAPPTT